MGNTISNRGPPYKITDIAILTTVFYVKTAANSNRSTLINLAYANFGLLVKNMFKNIKNPINFMFSVIKASVLMGIY